MRRLMTAAVLGFVLVVTVAVAPPPPKPSVPWGICEWCWWCIECYIVPAAPTAPSVDFDIQQTFNPF